MPNYLEILRLDSLNHSQRTIEVELQISYNICAEISQKSILWRKEAGDRRNFANTV